MEIIASNSDEFYRQKYLKYKKKYIDTQKLYEEELEGGADTNWIYYFCPEERYNEVKNLYDAFIQKLLPDFELRLGFNGYYITIKEKQLHSSQTDKLHDGIKWTDGLGIKLENSTSVSKAWTLFGKELKKETTKEESTRVYKEEYVIPQLIEKLSDMKSLITSSQTGKIFHFRITRTFPRKNIDQVEWLGELNGTVAVAS